MSTRCVACRKPVKRGQLFCPDCLEKRAPASVRKQECRRLGQLLELILSLPFLAVAKVRHITRDTVSEDTRKKMQHNMEDVRLFTEIAISRGIEPKSRRLISCVQSPIKEADLVSIESSTEMVNDLDSELSAEFDAWTADIDPDTRISIVCEMNTRRTQISSGRARADVRDVKRRLLALSSPLLSTFVVALVLLSLVLLIID